MIISGKFSPPATKKVEMRKERKARQPCRGGKCFFYFGVLVI